MCAWAYQIAGGVFHGDFRTQIGLGLILLGSVMLLDKLGVVHGAASLFFGCALFLAALYFLYYFIILFIMWLFVPAKDTNTLCIVRLLEVIKVGWCPVIELCEIKDLISALFYNLPY